MFTPLTTLPFALLLLLATGSAACAQPGGQPPLPEAPASQYDLTAPDAILELDKDLREISGLTFLDDQYLGAVQDEKGKLYILDPETGEIVDDKKFGDDNDFEGIERVGEAVYVLESDGDLHYIADWRADDLDADKIETALSRAHDTEGLGFDAAGQRLLIACKEFPGKGNAGKRAIFAFDLAAQALSEEPVYVMEVDTFNAWMRDRAMNERTRQLIAPLLDLSGFKPSGLAIHPQSGDVYVLSSVRKALVQLHADGAVAAVWPLTEDLFGHPESIAFHPDGTLYIANEGGGGRATLLRFSPRPRVEE